MSKSISRPAVPEFKNRNELFTYLKSNIDAIIAQKKAFPIKSDNFEFGYSIKDEYVPTGMKKKAGEELADMPKGELNIEVVGNLSGWCDSYQDVMIKDNWNKSINDAGASGDKIMYHLKNHDYSTDAIIAKDASIYAKMYDLSAFNIKTDIKKAQALMMQSTLVEDYDKKCFMLYRDKQIKQHSIGLQYIKLYLCLDSEEPEDAQYKDNWDKYYAQVINKEKVDNKGYFWAVVEAKILEVSVVLYGANELTPVESSGKTSEEITKDEPLTSTQSQPNKDEEELPVSKNWAKMAANIGS